MADQPTTPAATAEPSPPTAKPLGKASDLLKEVTAVAEGKGQQAATGAAASSAPTTGAAASASARTPAADKPADAGEDAVSRLAAIAREQRRLEKRKAALKVEARAQAEAAGNWQKLQDAKGKGDRMAALDALFSADEIEGELYTALTERIYNKGNGETGMSRADADALVARKLAEAKTADEAARKKAEDDGKATQAEAEAKATQTWLGIVTEAFDEAKYPALSAIFEDFPAAVSERDILAYADSYWKEHQKVPDSDAIWSHFEQKLTKKVTPAAKVDEAKAGNRVPGFSPSALRGDATPTDPNRKLSLKESLEEAKRTAWGAKPS